MNSNLILAPEIVPNWHGKCEKSGGIEDSHWSMEIKKGGPMRARITILTIFVVSLLSIGALADDNDKILKDSFEFSRDVTVGNTLVKKGRYVVKFNAQTSMVSIIDDKANVVVTARATMKMNAQNFDKDEILFTESGDKVVLTGLRLGGQKEELTLS